MTVWAIESKLPEGGGWFVANTFATEIEAQKRAEWMNKQWPEVRRRVAQYQRIEPTSTAS